MKKINYYIILMLLCITGCAPIVCKMNLYERNIYNLNDTSYSSNEVLRVSNNDPLANSYGNNNKAIVHQCLVMYKSPVTNSSNNVPIDVSLPLIK